MSAAQLLAGTPAGLQSSTGSESDLGRAVVCTAPPSASGYVAWQEGNTGRNYRRWVGLPGAGVSRATMEDFGYDPAAVAPAQPITRYAQYKPVAAMAGTGTQDCGEVLLNWGLLSPTRSGVLAAAAGPVVAGIPTINATDAVWFIPQAVPAGGIAAAPVVASIQPGVGFTLNAAIPAGEAWRYLVVAGAPV